LIVWKTTYSELADPVFLLRGLFNPGNSNILDQFIATPHLLSLIALCGIHRFRMKAPGPMVLHFKINRRILAGNWWKY
jgi:hypothetical protein